MPSAIPTSETRFLPLCFGEYEPTPTVDADPWRHPFSNHTQGHDEWLTPPSLLLRLGAFDLDPCAPIVRPWSTAQAHYTKQQNGLRRKWTGRVWLNPPYGSETGKWLGRLAEHGNGLALIFARTETTMFFHHVWPVADAILFIQGRINFHRVDGSRSSKNCGAPSCLIAYGSNNVTALKVSGICGAFVPLKVGSAHVLTAPTPAISNLQSSIINHQ